ncbi:cyclophilin-like fold protein [Paenibacillus sp. BR2-3]|uniref:cyclophilin-like fold protein n=1 Tax=Paenibacillus sp. BR2-3 TaxID=3048494 RepID=UPI0039777D3E
MKKRLALFLALAMIFVLSACASNTVSDNNATSSQPVSSSEGSGEDTGSSDTKDEPSTGEPIDESAGAQDVKIKMTVNGEEITATMYDNPTSRDFLSMLPLTLTFEDYNGTEKISYLPRNLTTEDAPEGFDPSVGELTLFVPWGNLAIFYSDFGYSRGLISLGRIDSGIETLANMNSEFIVTVEVLE